MSHKLITCLITGERALEAIAWLQEEEGITTANRYPARGASVNSGQVFKSIEILTLVVPEDRADELFGKLFDHLDVGHPGGGIIFQEALMQASDYQLPNLDQDGPKPA
ncbi:hypothetical protein [Marinospirillum perlucidum]|uniref:hypothetical protein n=1 Tax=Marinospirillum perlucidum TaxID=1982602 RepID=UPI000DF27E10|nr:hypothetical protein [Marinospirillum perlucidum]